MLMHFYNVIRDTFDLKVIVAGLNSQNNSLEISIFWSLQFVITFDEAFFSVKMVTENGMLSDKIRGKIITDISSDESVITTVKYLIDYSRLRIGHKYFMGDNYNEY